MKKLILCLLALSLSLTFIPNELKAAPVPEKTQTSAQAAEAKVLTIRLEELKAIDRSTLTKSEKQAFRKEVRSIHKQLRSISGGIYISVTALIVILILLVLFT